MNAAAPSPRASLPPWKMSMRHAPACCWKILARAPILEALETADVGILCMTPQPGELGARMAIVKIVERRQIRYAHMVGVTPEIMQQGMRADSRMVDRLSDKLRERMMRAE